MTPPTKAEVVEYFEAKGYRPEVGAKAFDYYDVAKWHDRDGKPVKCWKQKMIGVWFKPENKKGNGKINFDDDNAILSKCRELGIKTDGKLRKDLIARIQNAAQIRTA